MSFKSRLASVPFLRQAFLRFLRLLATDISIRNPWTGDRMRLNSFRHKGYWYFGKNREERTMARFAELIRPGQSVFEIGGHIGRLTQYFSKLVGDKGSVIVFEPGTNNLPYLESNIRQLSNVRLEKVAISDHEGVASFYQDDMTGQNNSLLSEYQGASSVERSHGMAVTKQEVRVNLTTLDAFVVRTGLSPDFIKMDIEGHELAALKGATTALSLTRGLMVEVTEKQHDVGELLARAGFVLSDESGNKLDTLVGFSGNVFALRK